MTTLTLGDIDRAEELTEHVRGVLREMGQEIYLIRTGAELGSQYNFDGYTRTIFAGTNYSGQEGPDWGVGTPIFSLQYYWYRASHGEYVTFPQDWLDKDWRVLERDRVEAERFAQQAAEEEAKRQRAIDREESDRRTFERLKAKYEQ